MTEVTSERAVLASRNPIMDYAVPPVDHAIAAMERQLISLGFPLEMLVKMMMQHAASVVALIDSPTMRQEVMQKAIGNFPGQVKVALNAVSMTQGGIVVPKGVQVSEPTGRPI
jgi:hypothetical protein